MAILPGKTCLVVRMGRVPATLAVTRHTSSGPRPGEIRAASAASGGIGAARSSRGESVWDGRKNNAEERPLRLALLAFVIATLAGFTPSQSADAPTKVRVGVLKFGTVSWVLDTIQPERSRQGRGIELDVMPLASTDATAVGLQGGSADIIATDWLWVSRERTGGADPRLAPSPRRSAPSRFPPILRSRPRRPRGKLGVAGGPIDKSWLLIVAYALRTANLDLRTETRSSARRRSSPRK